MLQTPPTKMSFLGELYNFIFPKRYPSAWGRQQIERETRRRNLRDEAIKREGREFANRRRTSVV
jgi:hypothetical protein